MSRSSLEYDLVVVGSGPNGLTAAAMAAKAGYETLLVEAADTHGGGARSVAWGGFTVDSCSAVHPSGLLSPAFQFLELERHGLDWIHAPLSAAHPMDGEPAVLLSPDFEETLGSIDSMDCSSYRRHILRFLPGFESLFGELLQPFSLKKSYLKQASFGARGILPASFAAKRFFSGERSRALFAGCCAHSILPFEKWGTAAFGLVFLLSGHGRSWPVARGGSQAISDALLSVFHQHGGTLHLGRRVDAFSDLPKARKYLFDLAPAQLASICRGHLPESYLGRLTRYKYGPGVFKIDYKLAQPIPWSDVRCADASTVHVGGDFAEIARSERDAWNGVHSDKPFLIVCQQSNFDTSRAPEGKSVGYVYCHVPSGSCMDMTARIESQIERFAPGFRDTVIERSTTSAQEFQRYNPSYVGGAVTGGASTIDQLFTRPVARFNPYSTPHPDIFIGSQSTPPGGGVHGMCGFNAVKSVFRSLGNR